MELTFAKCVRIPEVVRARQLNRVTRLALAFLVFLGATVQCWSMAACPQGSCPEMGIGSQEPQGHCGDEKDAHHHDGDKNDGHSHKSEGPCCCSISSGNDAAMSAVPQAVLNSTGIDIVLPSLAITLPQAATIDAPRQLHFYTGQSPPSVSEDPHFGRAPPVA